MRCICGCLRVAGQRRWKIELQCLIAIVAFRLRFLTRNGVYYDLTHSRAGGIAIKPAQYVINRMDRTTKVDGGGGTNLVLSYNY